jgi:hypothetical protein
MRWLLSSGAVEQEEEEEEEDKVIGKDKQDQWGL